MSDSSLTTDTKLRYLGLLQLKEKLMFNNCSVSSQSIHILLYIMRLNVCNCIKDRLPDRHSCLNLYPCVIKVQSVNQSISQSLSLSPLLSSPPPLFFFFLFFLLLLFLFYFSCCCFRFVCCQGNVFHCVIINPPPPPKKKKKKKEE